MQLFFNIITGFGKVLRYWQVVLLLVILQLIASWLLAYPLTSNMHEAWDYSLIHQQVGAEGFQPALAVQEVMLDAGSRVTPVYQLPFMLAYGGAYLVISIFIIAGLLPLYNGLDLKFNWDRFWADAARFFRPFLGLAIISILFFVIADLVSTTVADLVREAVADSDDEMTVYFSSVLFTTGLRFLLFSFVVMLFQYAKIASASEQLRNVLYLLREAVRFVARHFFRVLILFSILAFIEFGLTLLDIAVWHYMLDTAGTATRWVWLAFITTLLVMAKFSYFACQTEFFNEQRRRESEAGGVRLSSETYRGYTAEY